MAYDTLIVAAGARQSYFGHDEFGVHAPGLKTIDDALEVRGRIFGAFELAEGSRTERQRDGWLTFAVIGAGPPVSKSPVRSLSSRAERSSATSGRSTRRRRE